MEISLVPLCETDVKEFKREMQKAFKMGAVAEFGDIKGEVLPEKDIDISLSKKGAVAYKAMLDGKMAGGAIVVIDEKTQINSLDLLYVSTHAQGMGIGDSIWKKLEEYYPETLVWETCTPYFEKRNIHFYINKCGFHAVEFYNPRHKDPNISDDIVGGEYFFRFEKVMK